MRVRSLFALLCILALPALFAPNGDYKRAAPTPFAVVAVAGHTVPGTWCECGTAGCICDPGEVPIGNSAFQSPTDQGAVDQDTAPVNQDPDLPLGSTALLALAVMLLWFRMRV